MKLSVLDWIVIAAYGLAMLGVGLYYSRRTKTREDYLLGGRRMRPLEVGISLFAALLSTLSYLAWPGEMVKNGPMMFSALLAYPLIALVVGWLLIPFIMRLKVTSAYEILEIKLGMPGRMAGSVMFLTLRLLWMAVIVYAAGNTVLVPVLGLSPEWAPWVCVVLGMVTVAYTTLGGLRAVVLTDVIQSAILCGSALATVAVISYALGGPAAWWPHHWLTHWAPPVYGYDPSARATMFGAMLAMFTWYVCTSGSDQIAIQRYLATRDVRAARTVLLVSLGSDALVTLILGAVGLGLLAYYGQRPELLPGGASALQSADNLFVQFIVSELPRGVSGLVVAGLLAAAMSGLSAGVNSTSSVITVDFLERLGGRHDRTTFTARGVSVLVGVVVVAMSLLVHHIQGNLLEKCYKVVNLFTAPLFGLFFLAMFVPWANGPGALVGTACGVAVTVGINYWQEFTGRPGISFLWAMPLSLLAEVAVGAVASALLVRRRPNA
jgi:SSS family solute:Na+ symporter